MTSYKNNQNYVFYSVGTETRLTNSVVADSYVGMALQPSGDAISEKKAILDKVKFYGEYQDLDDCPTALKGTSSCTCKDKSVFM